MTPLPPTLLDELEAKHKAATKGPWDVDHAGEYSANGDMHCDQLRADGKVIADTLNADLRELRREDDEGGAYYFDPIGRTNLELIAALRNAAPDLIAAARENATLREQLQNRDERIETLRAYLR